MRSPPSNACGQKERLTATPLKATPLSPVRDNPAGVVAEVCVSEPWPEPRPCCPGRAGVRDAVPQAQSAARRGRRGLRGRIGHRQLPSVPGKAARLPRTAVDQATPHRLPRVERITNAPTQPLSRGAEARSSPWPRGGEKRAAADLFRLAPVFALFFYFAAFSGPA